MTNFLEKPKLYLLSTKWDVNLIICVARHSQIWWSLWFLVNNYGGFPTKQGVAESSRQWCTYTCISLKPGGEAQQRIVSFSVYI